MSYYVIDKLNKATSMMNAGDLDNAAAIFLEMQKVDEFFSVCCYQLASISNMTGDPETAYNMYYTAFKRKPKLASQLFGAKHTSFDYVFRGKKQEREQLNCPLCKSIGVPYWCYPLLEASGYNEKFNPIRMWLHCERCHHLFAQHFPEKLFLLNASPRTTNPAFFPYYSEILSKIKARGYAKGMTLFEVGIGASECLLAAREIGYQTFGIDVIGKHVETAKKSYGLNVETADFITYETHKKWDVIIMGDVLEHVSDPVAAVEKVSRMIAEDGCVWISTPTFESAFSAVVGHDDAMRRQQYHLNYFSRQSLYSLLENHGLTPVDYHISAHYNGSMEVVAVKKNPRKKINHLPIA